MGDCGLSQASGDLECFYKKELLIRVHVDDLLTNGIKEELDNIKKQIQNTLN